MGGGGYPGKILDKVARLMVFKSKKNEVFFYCASEREGGYRRKLDGKILQREEVMAGGRSGYDRFSVLQGKK